MYVQVEGVVHQMADLSFDRIVSYTSEGDKNTVFQLGVYMGYASITVWANRSQVAKFALSRARLVLLKQYTQAAISGKPNEKFGINFTKFDPDSKKWNQIGSLYIGRDDRALIYLVVMSAGHPAMKFPVKTELSFDTTDPMTDIRRSEIAAATLVEQLTVDIPTAMMLSNVKRDNIPRSGGQQSGGGDSSGFSF